jgi:hypothetical protein
MIFCGFKLSQEMFDSTQITKNWGIFQGQLWRNGWRLKKILEAPWLIYVILKGIGKVSNRFYKFSFLMLIGWSVEDAMNEKKDGDKMSLWINNSPRAEEVRHVRVVCKYLHVAQPEVGINISLSDQWGWHYRIFSVLLSRLLSSWMINGESLSVNYW